MQNHEKTFQLDPGAAYSCISSKLVREMGLKIEILLNPKRILIANGDAVNINESAKGVYFISTMVEKNKLVTRGRWGKIFTQPLF
ncbi:hypothetical protein ENBRE01_2888 [Enteropsectra breve]|nr:hypothetical protein ENBRE01_2888 [Enteropsectra breve]